MASSYEAKFLNPVLENITADQVEATILRSAVNSTAATSGVAYDVFTPPNSSNFLVICHSISSSAPEEKAIAYVTMAGGVGPNVIVLNNNVHTIQSDGTNVEVLPGATRTIKTTWIRLD